jgi:CDP-diacylglycerol--glycerol-3-phosphate 3-phosphatidyltransferase
VSVLSAGGEVRALTRPGTAAGAGATTRVRAQANVNLPNVLTSGRLLVVPVFAVVLMTSMDSTAGRVTAWGLFTLACFTDVLDGHLARRRDQITAFGIMADPIADKALTGTAFVGLSVLGLLPWWATALILVREVGVTLLRTALLRHGLLPASRGGKLKCLAQNIAVALYLLPLELLPPSGALADLRLPVLVLAVVLTVVTAVQYVAAALTLRREAQAGVS